ncbi:hypothetical protein ACUNV4_11440 [Granulosicoccus sp. 3-233]
MSPRPETAYGSRYTLDSLPNVAGNYDAAHRLMEAQKPWFDKEFGDSA